MYKYTSPFEIFLKIGTVSEINGDFGRNRKFSPPLVYLTPPQGVPLGIL